MEKQLCENDLLRRQTGGETYVQEESEEVNRQHVRLLKKLTRGSGRAKFDRAMSALNSLDSSLQASILHSLHLYTSVFLGTVSNLPEDSVPVWLQLLPANLGARNISPAAKMEIANGFAVVGLPAPDELSEAISAEQFRYNLSVLDSNDDQLEVSLPLTAFNTSWQ